MLSFYPEFEAQSTSNVELIFLLDLSCSMLVGENEVFSCSNVDIEDIFVFVHSLFLSLSSVLWLLLQLRVLL